MPSRRPPRVRRPQRAAPAGPAEQRGPLVLDVALRWVTRNNLHLQGNHRATGLGGTCFGDSGGPHFWEDTLILVSVTSWGDAICRSNDMTQRTDIPSVLDWLAEEFEVAPPA